MHKQDCEIPNGLYYTREHEWVCLEGEYSVVGVTDYAQKSLHEIVFVETPIVGSELKRMETMCVIESVKAVSDVFAPLSGMVTEVNEDLAENPHLLNKDPYGAGWIAKIVPSNVKNELTKMMPDLAEKAEKPEVKEKLKDSIYCPNCGNKIMKEWKFCPTCRAKIPRLA